MPNEIHAQIVIDDIEIESHIYKTRGLTRLELTVFQPAHKESDEKLPAIIFFHGGGLRERHTWEFRPQSAYLVDRGMVAVVATYTVKRHGRTISESIADAKSAIRWIRDHANELGIDENRLAAGGGSAGGYLAACSALIKDYDENNEDLSISSVPNALVLFNPRLVLPVIGDPPLNKKEIRYLNGRNVEEISPVHNVYKGAPPSIIFQGTADKKVSLRESEWFYEEMNNYGNPCEVVLYEGREHGFFKYFSGNNPDFLSTMETTVKFLSKLGYISQDNQ
ncbi:MAG: alpha/beta hydrolase [Candidatus Heimdallarchaeota archaeon]|nr:alpha/beta hydrolase [Candidatus Heimdallarchaeota archaeon]